MIPVRSLQPRSRRAVVTAALIALNLFAFYWELQQGTALPRSIRAFGLRPIVFTSHWQTLSLQVWIPLVTSMFLHGGWLHLLGNMLFLWVFGGNVEDRLGHGRFLGLYLASGLLAAATQMWVAPDAMMPMIGASGAIAGVLGAYLFLFPRARVLTLVPILFLFFFWELPAILVLALWFLGQFVSGVAVLDTGQALYGGVAYWAHIGGFLAGALSGILLEPQRSARPRPGTWAVS